MRGSLAQELLLSHPPLGA
uniref:Uncharacterized protein n=1 Tax=Arundo donax TaxID=35708 RepID=A0A0A9C354_ARUDO